MIASGYFNLGVFHHFEDLVRLAKIVQIRYTYAVFWLIQGVAQNRAVAAGLRCFQDFGPLSIEILLCWKQRLSSSLF